MTQDHPIELRDQRISAYLDGTMSENDMQAFEDEMERDPDLAEAVLRWQSNDTLLKAAFDAPMQEPVDDAMLARFGLGQSATPNNIVDISAARDARAERSRMREVVTRWRWPAGAALAASLLAAIALGPQFGRDASFELGRSKSFQVAMQTAPSLAKTAVENGQTVSAMLSFTDGTGRYCREFALAGQGTPERGIVCKAGNEWQIEARVKAATPASSSGEIRTAGGDDGASLDRAYRALNASDPLGREDEMALIAKGWKK